MCIILGIYCTGSCAGNNPKLACSHTMNFDLNNCIYPNTMRKRLVRHRPDTQKCGLCMSREYRERFPRHRLQRKPLVSDHGMHYGTCITHVPWCMSGSLTRGGGENFPCIPSACTTRNSAYLVRGPLKLHYSLRHIGLFYSYMYILQIWYVNIKRDNNIPCRACIKNTKTQITNKHLQLPDDKTDLIMITRNNISQKQHIFLNIGISRITPSREAPRRPKNCLTLDSVCTLNNHAHKKVNYIS